MPTLPVAPPATFGRRASGSDFGADAAAARGQAELPRAIGGLAEAGLQIKAAADEMRLGRRAAEVSAQLDQLRFELDADPDIDTHESRFEERSQALLERSREGLDSPAATRLEDRVFPALAHSRLEVSAGVRRKRIDASRADLDEAVRLNSEQTAGTLDPVRRAQIRGQTVGLLERARAAGLIDQAKLDESVQFYDANAAEALARRGKNYNPVATLQDLEARRGGFENMAEGRRQAWIEEMTNEIQQRERFAKAERAEAEARAEKAQREAQEEAVSQGYLVAAQGLMDMEWVKENRALLPPSAVGYFSQVAAKAAAPKEIPDQGYWFRMRSLQIDRPQEFAREQLDPAKLGPETTLKLKKAQQEIAKGVVTQTGRTFVGRLNARVKKAPGLTPEEQAELQRAGEADLEDFERAKGAKATPKEQESIVDALFLERVRQRAPGWFSSGDTEILPPEATLAIEGVDDALARRVIRKLNQLGQPVTVKTVKDIAGRLAK